MLLAAICKAPKAAAAEGLSKFMAVLVEWPPVAVTVVAAVAGDFLTCCGEDRGP